MDEEPKISGNAWGNISTFDGASLETAKDLSNALPGSFLDEEFRRTYEETWGVSKADLSGGVKLQVEKGGNSECASRRVGLRRVRWMVGPITSKREQFRHKAVLTAIKHRKEAERREQPSLPRRAFAAIKRRRESHRPPVKLEPGEAPGLFHSWQKHFAVLKLRQDQNIEGRKHPKIVQLTKRLTNAAFRDDLIGNGTSISLRKAWKALPVQRRRDVWPELMLNTLDEHPTKALKLLVATYTESYPPGYAVSDSLDYIVSYYLRNRSVRSTKNALEIFRVFEHMLRLGPPGHFDLSQNSVYLLLKNLDDIFVGMLYQTLTEFQHPLSRNTLMHFSPKLRLSGGADERMDILRRLWREGSDFNSPEISSVCVTLLQRKNRSSKVTYSDSEIFEFMLECGMKPNIIIYNVLLQNSLDAGDHETAWQIHDMMVENGIETDAYTYSILLSDARLRKDRPSIKHIINIVTEKGMWNAHIVTDLLHTIFIFRHNYEISPHWKQKGRPPKAFDRMLTVYRQYFHLDPLANMIPWLEDAYSNNTRSTEPNASESAPTPKEAMMDAPVPTLVVMLTALLRELTEPRLVITFYNHFCDLVKAGDPTAAALSKSTHVYNIILMALGRFPETLAFCTRLIGDMLSQNLAATSMNIDSSPPADGSQCLPQVYRPVHDDAQSHNPGQIQAHSEVSPRLASPEQPSDTADQAKPISGNGPSPSQQRLHPKPDIYTWSILLKVFMDRRQPRAAEKVLTMMKDRDVWPNQVTWNSLIFGYARMQDMSMTVDAVNRLQRGGFDLDGVTMRGLTYLENRRALIEAMRASEAKNPGESIKKQGPAIGLDYIASNKTLRIVGDRNEGENLVPQVEEVDDESEMECREYEAVTSVGRTEEDGEFVVRDIPHERDKFADSDG